jgi:hypothetical protein
MSLREARDLFFARSNLGPDGGYERLWVRVETKPLPFYFPNWSARVAAARLHDLHHIAANYETDWPGEAEISAWEIGGGCCRYYAAWILNLGGWGAGLIITPRKLLRAFVRGRRSKTNLYHTGFDELQLDQITLGGLRDRLGSHTPTMPAAFCDVVLFGFWSLVAIGWWCLPPLLALALIWLIVRARLS